MEFYIGQKFANRKGIRINILDVGGDYVETETYDENNSADKTRRLHVNKILEEHLKEFKFEKIA